MTNTTNTVLYRRLSTTSRHRVRKRRWKRVRQLCTPNKVIMLINYLSSDRACVTTCLLKMADRRQVVHKSGPLKQQNKSHKSGKHRTKGQIAALSKGASTYST